MTENEPTVTLKNHTGLKWAFSQLGLGYGLGTLSYRGRLLEHPLEQGVIFLRHLSTGEVRWLPAGQCVQSAYNRARLSGSTSVEGLPFSFQLDVMLPADHPAAELVLSYQLTESLPDWQVGLAYHAVFDHAWNVHFYPFVADAKFIAEPKVVYPGVPSALLYRDDFSLALLFGFDPTSDYLNPTTYTGECGFFFTDQVIPPQFRLGGKEIAAGSYAWDFQVLLSDAGSYSVALPDLVQNWLALNDFKTDGLFVRSADEALDLFVRGRRNTSLWIPGVGYKIEEENPHFNFVYIGEQPLSAYFEYLLYEMTGNPVWRQRCFEQIDFVLKAQNQDPASPFHGAMDTTYDVWKLAFDSDDRGYNVGLKPDLNAHMARYILLTWERVKAHEGLDRQDWYQAALKAADWVLRQRNSDSGLPQKVEAEFEWVKGNGSNNYLHKSISSTSGRAVPAMPVIHMITGLRRFSDYEKQLVEFTRTHVEDCLKFTGHHPDLPPDELEEASIWGIIEYWLGHHDRTGEQEALQRALADAYLAFLWWCPKQLSWVKNPTQCASAEQQHFLQYSLYCYQNRKVECLWRLYEKTGDPFFQELYDRALQGIFWTQDIQGDTMGATYERVADPWLIREVYTGGPATFDSLGVRYIGEQSLDAMLQILELWRTGKRLFISKNMEHKVYPDGVCYYSRDVRGLSPASLQILPAQGTLKVVVTEPRAWKLTTEGSNTVRHEVWDLVPGGSYIARGDTGEADIGRLQAGMDGKIAFTLIVEAGKTSQIRLDLVG